MFINSHASASRRRIASATSLTAMFALQVVALTRPATACPVRFTIDITEKIITRAAAPKDHVISSETAPVVRGKLISTARRSAPKMTAAALRRKTTAVAAAATGKNSLQH